MTTNFEPSGDDLMGFYEISPDRKALSPLVGMWFTYVDETGERFSGRIVEKVGNSIDHTDASFIVETFEVAPQHTIPPGVLHVVRYSTIIDTPWSLYRSMVQLADDL